MTVVPLHQALAIASDHHRNGRLPQAAEIFRRTGDSASDRRAITRGGRRNGDEAKAWYVRRPLLLATVSLVFMGWRRLRALVRTPNA